MQMAGGILARVPGVDRVVSVNVWSTLKVVLKVGRKEAMVVGEHECAYL